jgi:diaminopimelate decarboxylase
MNNIRYNNKILQIEQVKVLDIAIPTPFYAYSAKEIEDNYNQFAKYSLSDLLICFALKSNSNVVLVEILAKLGAGADCVSVGEIKKAINAGISSDKIVFSGVGKSSSEIEFAILSNILQFNVESEEELLLINDIANRLNKKPRIAIRINPDINAMTHRNITTGTKCDKFGIDSDQLFDIYQLASSLSNIEIVGISIHIGSQITKIAPFIKAFDFVLDVVGKLKNLNYEIKTIDLGGGVGIKYHPLDDNIKIDDYMKLLIDKFGDLGCKIIIEPGRAIIGSSGILVSSVLYNKKTPSKEFLIIDAGMNNFMRTCLYQAYHKIVSLKQDQNQQFVEYDVVGPICESSDIFAKNRSLPAMRRGDKIAILDTGAYGAVMSSNYNSRIEAAEILINGDKTYLIKKDTSRDQLAYIKKISQ